MGNLRCALGWVVSFRLCPPYPPKTRLHTQYDADWAPRAGPDVLEYKKKIACP